MKKAIIAALASMLVLTGLASAQGETRVVHRYCVNVEQGTDYPSYGDLNLYRGGKRICLVGKPGKNGRNGKAGARGARGPVGLEGLPGPAGDDGLDGKNGEDGIDGAEGPPGRQGEQGLQGPQGPEGQQGPPGQTGATGATGPPGPQGEPGPPGPGANLGDLYFCVSNGGNVKYSGLTPDECDPGHDLVLRVDGVEVVQ